MTGALARDDEVAGKAWFPFRVVRYGDVDHPQGGDSWAVLSADDPDDKAVFYDCEDEAKARAICYMLNRFPLYRALADAADTAVRAHPASDPHPRSPHPEDGQALCDLAHALYALDTEQGGER